MSVTASVQEPAPALGELIHLEPAATRELPFRHFGHWGGIGRTAENLFVPSRRGLQILYRETRYRIDDCHRGTLLQRIWTGKPAQIWLPG
jgi:hypothetical protein